MCRYHSTSDNISKKTNVMFQRKSGPIAMLLFELPEVTGQMWESCLLVGDNWKSNIMWQNSVGISLIVLGE